METVKDFVKMLEDILQEVCDSYCKYPQQYVDQEKLWDEHCEKCPLGRLYV